MNPEAEYDSKIQANLGPVYDKLDDLAIKLNDLEETLDYIMDKLSEILDR